MAKQKDNSLYEMEKQQQKVLYFSIGAMLFIVFSFSIFNLLFAEKDCFRYDMVMKLQLDGMITNKGRDTRNHDIEALWIQQKDFVIKKLFGGDLRRIYDLAETGDHIKKEKGELIFFINGRKYDLFNYECDEKSLYINF